MSGERSIRKVEDIGSQVSQFAMAKALASGDGRLIRKAGLETEIARLQRQRAAHVDDQHDIRRRIHGAHAEQADAESRMAAIRSDLAQHASTRGDAFSMEITGRTFTERKVAGDVLLSKFRLEKLQPSGRTWTIGRIGGFDLTCAPQRRFLLRRDETVTLLLRRTDYDQAIDVGDELTALGVIARLENMLDHLEADLEFQARRREGAIARLAGYEPRLGEPFPLREEFDFKLQQMAELEADLAGKDAGAGKGAEVASQPTLAPSAHAA